MTRSSWSIRPFDVRRDGAGLLKLWTAVSGFDGSVAAPSEAVLDALLASPAGRGAAAWRIATAGNGGIVGSLEVMFVGTRRTEVRVVVNPAWRRQGLGAALLRTAPPDRWLLATSRSSVGGASELLASLGFHERYRAARLRRASEGLAGLPPRAGARIADDPTRDLDRVMRALRRAFDEGDNMDIGVWRARLSRPGCRVLYLTVGEDDEGICIVAGNERAKKSERDKAGIPTTGVVERVGLSKALRGKKLSRPLVRAGLVALTDAGYDELEVTADRRRPAAVALYEEEGFVVVDEEVHWSRKEPTDTASLRIAPP